MIKMKILRIYTIIYNQFHDISNFCLLYDFEHKLEKNYIIYFIINI